MVGLQLNLFGEVDEKPVRGGHLATPLTREEQRRIGKMYADNIKLVGMFQAKMRKKYGHSLLAEDINSCVDIAFIKAARKWDPDKGTFSTIFGHFVIGECLHAIRMPGNWGIAAPQRVREAGIKAKNMLAAGLTAADVCSEMAITEDDLLDILRATTGLAHEIREFDMYACGRPTPWETLEAN